MTDIADIEDEDGNVVGKIDLEIMRALAPHPELTKVLDDGGMIYMRKNGIRSSLSLRDTKKKTRRR